MSRDINTPCSSKQPIFSMVTYFCKHRLLGIVNRGLVDSLTEPILRNTKMTLPVVKPQFSLTPKSIDEAIRLAEMMSKSNIVPKEFASNPGNILVAIQWGMELGLQPLQAMQSIAVINGRPSLWGDAVLALVKSSTLCEYVIEESTDDGAVCRVKRVGEGEQSRSFTKVDAAKASLIGKQGPWTQYPKRMMQMRARSWALRDVFPDVLRGMAVAEELQDIEQEVGPLAAKQTEQEKPASYPDADFEKNMPAWVRLISTKAKTIDEVLDTLASSTKGALTSEQVKKIKAIKVMDSQADAIEGEIV